MTRGSGLASARSGTTPLACQRSVTQRLSSSSRSITTAIRNEVSLMSGGHQTRIHRCCQIAESLISRGVVTCLARRHFAIIGATSAGLTQPIGASALYLMTTTDKLNRPLRDLRISVTDRCNFRCVYCMPKEVFGKDYQFLDRKEL